MNTLQKLLDFLSRLDKENIDFKLSRNRETAIMVEVAVPGARWEIEFFADGSVEVEIFSQSSGVQEAEHTLDHLIDVYGEGKTKK